MKTLKIRSAHHLEADVPLNVPPRRSRYGFPETLENTGFAGTQARFVLLYHLYYQKTHTLIYARVCVERDRDIHASRVGKKNVVVRWYKPLRKPANRWKYWV